MTGRGRAGRRGRGLVARGGAGGGGAGPAAGPSCECGSSRAALPAAAALLVPFRVPGPILASHTVRQGVEVAGGGGLRSGLANWVQGIEKFTPKPGIAEAAGHSPPFLGLKNTTFFPFSSEDLPNQES